MKKGLILGMVGLGVGCAVLGGVGGHFMTKSTNNNIQAESGITAEKAYESYMLPDGLKNVSFNKYELNEKYDLLTDNGNAGTYLVDKETGAFNYISISNYIYDVFALTETKIVVKCSNSLSVLNTENMSFEKIDLGISDLQFGSEFTFDNLGNMCFLTYSNDLADNYVVMIDKDMKVTKFKTSNLLYGSVYDNFIHVENKLIVLREIASTNYEDRVSVVIDKETGEVNEFSGVVASHSSEFPSFAIKGNKIYYDGFYSDSSFGSSKGFFVLDIIEKTVETLGDASYGPSRIFSTDKVLVYATDVNNYSQVRIVNIETGEISTEDMCRVVQNEKGIYIAKYENETFNFYKLADDGSLNLLHSKTILNSYGCHYFQYKNAEYLYLSGGSYDSCVFKLSYKDDGSEIITEMNVTFNFAEYDEKKIFELSDGSAIYLTSSIVYYDAEKDVYKNLIQNYSSIDSLEEKDEIVTIYLKYDGKGMIYEFNMKDLSIALVGYFDVEE